MTAHDLPKPADVSPASVGDPSGLTLEALQAVSDCRNTPGMFVNLAQLRKAMVLVDAALGLNR